MMAACHSKSNMWKQASSPQTHTKVMLIVGDPAQAFHLAAIPNEGVGLARIEFIVTNQIGVHPMALAQFPNLKDLKAINEIRNRIAEEDPREFFIRRLSEGVARIAAAFYPKPVIVRTSDFKTNEYARLLGGAEFEPKEENPMIGLSRRIALLRSALLRRDSRSSARRWRVCATVWGSPM